HVCNVGESTLQTKLDGLVLPDGVRLGFKTWLPYNTIVLYGRDAAALAAAADAVEARLDGDVFGRDDVTFPLALGRALQARGWTLALAESCTGGGAGALVTEAPGSSAWFLGAVVSYANAVKEQTLGVPADVLARDGAVSESVAAAMAAGARRVTGADCAVSITGVAGPDGGTADKPVGQVCFGLETPDGAWTRTVQFGARGRDWVRSLAAAAALEWLRRRLLR
ncbi:MAG: nicotinamide-nucleotide amidohydrolase family protein, partial [Planctomycetota bacterium]